MQIIVAYVFQLSDVLFIHKFAMYVYQCINNNNKYDDNSASSYKKQEVSFIMFISFRISFILKIKEVNNVEKISSAVIVVTVELWYSMAGGLQ